jgi:hypothetical protein
MLNTAAKIGLTRSLRTETNRANMSTVPGGAVLGGLTLAERVTLEAGDGRRMVWRWQQRFTQVSLVTPEFAIRSITVTPS